MPRHKSKKQLARAKKKPEPEEPHPFADPQRPIPNLTCADRFEYYYFTQHLVEPGWEWARFINTMHQALPITFRIQPTGDLGEECRKSFADLMAREALPEVTPLPWCDSWSVGISKEALKVSTDPVHVRLQGWIAKWAALGALSRQAIESMVPVGLLQVEPHHIVCDLCASPGSKTTQAIEALFAKAPRASSGGGTPTRGFMVANDMSPQRCQMLMRRCAALGEMSERLIVTCHPAQSMPRLPPICTGGGGGGGGGANGGGANGGGSENDGRYPDGCYDRIICDVPCSGDGTTRKNPSIWHRWSVEYALEMHRLQLQIALRAVALIKVGGLVAYSTCSLNPLENESVVAELLTRGGGALEIVDCSDRLVELNRAKGLSSWTVLDDEMNEHVSHAALRKSPLLNKALKRRYMPSMWPPAHPEPLHLDRCLRLLPHLANMGGFFVALIRKVRPLPGPPTRSRAVPSVPTEPAASAAAAESAHSIADWAPPRNPAIVAAEEAIRAYCQVLSLPAATAEAQIAKVHAEPDCTYHEEMGGKLARAIDESSASSAAGTEGKPARKGMQVVPAEMLAALASQLGLKKSGVRDALGDQLICASAKAAVVCRVAPDVAAICAPLPPTVADTDGANAAGAAAAGGATRKKKCRSLRVVSAGCILARRTRGGTFQPTAEGARALAPHASKQRRLQLSASDALLLIDRAGQQSKRRRAVLLSELSSTAADAARALPVGPCLLMLQPSAKGRPALTVPARRLREPEGLRLLILYTAGLEFRPAAMLHSARAWLDQEC